MRYLLFLTLLGAIMGCQREVEEPTEVDYSYFPMQVGHFVEYRVDSTLYNDFSYTVDSSSYLVREEIGELQTDNAGNDYNRLYRYKRLDSLASWGAPRVWTVQMDGFRALRLEENLRFIRMVFPVRADKKWDGLVYIGRDTVIVFDEETSETIDMFKDWEHFVYTNVNEPDTINGLVFPETVTVWHVDKVNNIELRYSMEKYAKNVGLIYKEAWILDTQCKGNIADCLGLDWKTKAEKGFILRQSIVAYGN